MRNFHNRIIRVHTDQRGAGLIKLFFLALLFVLTSFAATAIYFRDKLDPNFFEENPPIIEVVDQSSGIGSENAVVHFKLSDKDSGLDEFVVRGEQAGRKFELLKKQYKDEKITDDTVELEFSGREIGLREGDFHISYAAFDRSFYSNKITGSLDLSVDYSRTPVEVLTPQHNAVIGGVEFVFYSVKNAQDLALTGVKAGSDTYQGFPATELNPAFKAFPNVYFALFPVPIDFDRETTRLLVFSKTNVGNMATAPFYYLIGPRGFPKRQVKLTSEAVNQRLEQLSSKAAGDTNEIAQRFSKVSADLKEQEKTQLRQIWNSPLHERLWATPFIHPTNGSIRSSFGEQRRYTIDNQDALSESYEAIDMGSAKNSMVVAANKGKVVFVGNLPYSGKSVILDHGFGLASMYSSLGTTNVALGAIVSSGDPIGTTGVSGFSFADMVRFQIFLHGKSVTPIEWWDERWQQDHIEAKIKSTLDGLVSTAVTESKDVLDEDEE